MKPLNGLWLFNVDFEEIDTALTYAKFEKNKVTKQHELESVIENKLLQEITMETKFKIGDRVLITKPKDVARYHIAWVDEMDEYNGQILEVSSISVPIKGLPLEYGVRETRYVFDESWLTKVEDEAITEEPKVVELKSIDWEQRRWELASKLYAEMENITIESAVRQADIFIKYYKLTLK